MSTLQIKTPRVFLPLLSPTRYKGAHGGRGSGKSHFFAELLIETCLLKPTRAVGIREIQKSIAQSVKLLLEDKIKALGVTSQFRILDDRIEAPHDGLIIFQGMQNHTADSIKSLEGYDIAWLAEAQAISQRSLDLLRPTIRKPGSEIWADWNPETDETPIDQLLRGKNKVSDAIVVEANWRDNPFFPEVLRREMEEDKRRDYDKYLHIWEGHYRVALEGAVYAEELRKAIEDKRIGKIPYVSSKGVVAIFDLGHADATAIWFLQCIGHEFRLIDYYENQFKKIQHYMEVMQARGYVYERIVLPHDADYETLTADRTAAAIVRNAFPNAQVTVLERMGVTDGIDAARTLFGQCWFDEDKCSLGLKALRHYRYDKDPDTGKTSKNPLHDWSSHCADAFRYMAVSITEQQTTKRRRAATNGWMG